MKPALELAVENYQRLRDEAAAAMAHAQKELSSLRNTLATLESYRSTLQDRRRETDDKSHSATSLQLDTHLAGRIDSAVKQQERFIEQAMRRAELKRLALLDCQKRLKAVETILKQRAEQQAAAASRRERLEADEQAAIRYLNQSSLPDIGTTRIPVPLDQEELYIA
ncbi:flagellar export protein FliJ [Lautropia mirabilis ATCC 51599]|uniref:Flagellar FliJ protein n=1 Tax=Lautropia mirabilis ATCC 51599 TaxID=887898 RepID=E7RX76_9BURK|nr:flagellar export protein FliJ [Lautropia mirabilis]EFV94872.1 putative flagellar export protein FliJ [Lautropia mirabilis ATCC 51599]VEH01566.1 flagellar biosynthesis chaperone [Lautropia mirabilis]